MMPWLSAALWEAAFTRHMKEWNEGMGTFEGGPALKRAAQDALRLKSVCVPRLRCSSKVRNQINAANGVWTRWGISYFEASNSKVITEWSLAFDSRGA